MRRPPFSSTSALSLSDSSDHFAFYNFLTDTLVFDELTDEILGHETAHRVSCVEPWIPSVFTLTRRLAPLSYTLISSIRQMAIRNRVRIVGNQLATLAPAGGPERIRAEIARRLDRLRQIEDVIDMGWRTIAPIAELFAIDFGDAKYKTWMTGWTSEASPKGTRQKKAAKRHVEAVAASYPADFGGYNVSVYGSFQGALHSAWDSYSRIPDHETRKELFRSAACSLYLDEKGLVRVNDPLGIIINQSALARTNPALAQRVFAGHQIDIKQKVNSLGDVLESLALTGVEDNARYIEAYSLALFRLVRDQRMGKIHPELLTNQYLSFAQDPAQSFLWCTVEDETVVRAQFNPLFVSPSVRKLRGLENASPEWWREVLLVELVRQGLKTGEPVSCPFSDSKLEATLFTDKVQCSKQCAIARWLQNGGKWCDFMVGKPCHSQSRPVR